MKKKLQVSCTVRFVGSGWIKINRKNGKNNKKRKIIDVIYGKIRG